ncbi:MAG: DciA family protein [Ignavibacteriaceae bacterium]
MHEIPVSIAEILKTSPELAKLRESLERGEVIARLYEIFPDFVNRVEAQKLDKKALHLCVENAALRNELKFQENEIVDKINKFFGSQRINKIVLNG